MTKALQEVANLVLIDPEIFSLDNLVEKFLWNETDIQEYKRASVQLGHSTIVFGSWLYTKRVRNNRSSLGIMHYVDPTTLDHNRIILINGAINYLNSLNSTEISKSAEVKCIEKLLNWLNKTNTKTPTTLAEAKVVYKTFTTYLQHIVKTHNPKKANAKLDEDSFGGDQAYRVQLVIRSFLSQAFHVETVNIEGTTERISRTYRQNSDYTIDQEGLDEALSYCFQFFEQVANFCLDAKPYPHKIRLLEHEALLTPEAKNQGGVLATITGNRWSKSIYWNLSKGYLHSEEELCNLFIQSEEYGALKGLKKKNAKRKQMLGVLQNKQNDLIEANKSFNHQYRLELGLRAMKAYFLVLLDITSMNDSTLATIKWEEDDFTEEKGESVILRNIKRRAGNKEVVFTIQSIFMGSFRTFLKLRRFVLDGYDCDTLFFIGTGSNARLTSTIRKGQYGVRAHETLASFYPKLKFFGSRRQREHAKRWAMKKSKGQTFLAAAWLQHSPNVSEQNYPSESREETQNQIGNYLNYQHKVTMEVKDEQFSSSGACNSSEAIPKADSETLSIKPNCQIKMTCLFCIHYRIKPIANEIHKLLSMEYVTKRHSILYARSQTQFDEVMGPILKRISLLFKVMEKKYPETKNVITEVRHDVFENQNLHWYWEKKLEQLWELGWI